MATYRSRVGTPLRLSGNDHNGAPHDAIVFGDDGLVTVPDDQQEYAQTLKHNLERGFIEVAPKKRRKDS